MTVSDLRVGTAVANNGPAAKLIYLIIDECGPCTQQELRSRTDLSMSTVSRVVRRLDDQGVITDQPTEDGRSQSWRVANNLP